jgi:heterodisulfide reductase subunit B
MNQPTYLYYPGCALQHRSHAYEVSNQAVAKALGIELIELDDWNCCGATEYFSVNRLPAYALVARNLALPPILACRTRRAVHVFLNLQDR